MSPETAFLVGFVVIPALILTFLLFGLVRDIRALMAERANRTQTEMADKSATRSNIELWAGLGEAIARRYEINASSAIRASAPAKPLGHFEFYELEGPRGRFWFVYGVKQEQSTVNPTTAMDEYLGRANLRPATSLNN